MNKKMISTPFEWCIEKYPGLCTLFIKTSKCYLMFMFYHTAIQMFGTLEFRFIFCAKMCSGCFKMISQRNVKLPPWYGQCIELEGNTK